MTAPELVLRILDFSEKPMPVHQIAEKAREMGFFYNENNLSTRCSELAKEGKIRGFYSPGVHFKFWAKVRAEKSGQLLMSEVA